MTNVPPGYPPVPPGGYPPGVVPPGAYPPGVVPPGAYPPGVVPPGGYPPGYGYPPLPPGAAGPLGAAGADGYGRDTLFGNAPVPSTDAFALQNAKMLKANLGPETGLSEFFAKAGSMVAYQGGINFDGNSQSWGQHVMTKVTGHTGLPLMKVTGTGSVYLANQAMDVHVLALTGDSFTIDRDNLLAFSSSLRWDIVRVDSQQQIGGMDAYNIELSGHGQFVACSTGAPLVMNVTPNNYYFADADAVLGWSTDLQVSMQAAVTSSSVWKPRGNTGESWQMVFAGQGQVIVQPAELLPPYQALAAGGGLAAAFGAGLAANNNFGGRPPGGR